MNGVRPLGDRALIRPAAPEKVTAGGIVIPEAAQEKTQRGEVLAVGLGAVNEDGSRIPLDVAEGDEVLVSKYGGTEIEIDGEELLVVREGDVIAVLEGNA
jgi:chaperonin GroES